LLKKGAAMSRASKSVLIVAAIVLALVVALHIFAGPMMSSLAHTIHGR
jgi:preprotein translocase subunit Sec61beta